MKAQRQGWNERNRERKNEAVLTKRMKAVKNLKQGWKEVGHGAQEVSNFHDTWVLCKNFHQNKRFGCGKKSWTILITLANNN